MLGVESIAPTRFGANQDDSLQVLSEDGDFVLCRGWRGSGKAGLALFPVSPQPRPAKLDRLVHEFSLRDELDGTWAVRPLELVQDRGRTVLVLEDPGGGLLSELLGPPMEVEGFLYLAVGMVSCLGKVHERGLVHKDIKPANILVNSASGEVRLTGFGIASRLPRERQAPEPPEVIAGTLAYMAPEQTGRMNRSIDSRSDLYALGVTFYQMLTGALPFAATDPMEWVHCHIARKPVAPDQRIAGIPEPLSDIVMKLLTKTAEERYQTAAGVERDLRHCLAEWQKGFLAGFPLGEADAPDRLLIPEKLYGREREVDTLLASFDRIVKSGAPELVLVSGYSGIGKSSVVNELHPVLVPPRGLFAAGKFDQHQRDIPYATLAQAFQSLVRPLLSKSDTELGGWRDALTDAFGANGRLMTDLVPELKLIIGEQPLVPELQPRDAQRRFQQVFQRFIGVFARPEHPLALFLDDLQWLDAATLDLIEEVLTRSDLQHLMLIGAYRDNEVGDAHPLRQKLDAIKTAGGKTAEIALGPLGNEHLGQLIADTVRCDAEHAAPLARLVLQKTDGNPFFVNQFLTSMAEEGLLTFDHPAGRWIWDLKRIHARGYTDNVVDLMVSKLSRLSTDTQRALQQLACLGNSAEFALLALIQEHSKERLDDDLQGALRAGLILISEGTFRFLHDRVQEAAYSLIPEARRAEAHLQIGRLLVARIPSERQHEAIFEIVNQLNRGTSLITSRGEKEQLAELNLIAGKRAKASTAYGSALRYFVAGTALLSDDEWDRRPGLMFALNIHRAECEFLTGELALAEARLTMLLSRTADPVDRASVACLCSDLYTRLNQTDRAVTVCTDYLRHFGIDWSPHPTEEEVRQEYERTWFLLGRREIEDLIDLPLMSKPDVVATVEVLTRTLAPANRTDVNLFSRIIWRVVNLSLEYGNTDASCYAYVRLAADAGPRFGNYKAGFRFGRLGYELVERRGLRRFKARTYLGFAIFTASWTTHWRTGRALIHDAFNAANAVGDFTYAAYSRVNLIGNLIAAGDPLVNVLREAERSLEFAQQLRFGPAVDLIMPQLTLVQTLCGLTVQFGCFNGTHFDELQFERRLSSDPSAFWYWTRKLQARFFAGDFATAVDASFNAQQLLRISPSYLESAEAHFYGALSHAALCGDSGHAQYWQHLQALMDHHKQLVEWVDDCPENFENRVSLVDAEIARVEGRELEAERLYEQAIRSAHANGFVHNEAVASECAGRFYLTRGFERIANAYFRDARDSYLRWGADGKVRQLDQLYPHLAAATVQRSVATIASTVQQLDAASVIEASQALSSEIELPNLVRRLMTIAIENAGAERGLLILASEDDYLIQAEARAAADQIEVTMRQEPINGIACPESLVRYVIRTRGNMILDDASKPNSFSADSYLLDNKSKSIFCLPLIKQQQLIGVLLLENALTSHAFTPARIAVLELLAAQAAISIENTRLYSDLQERETKVRRLVDSSIIGILIGNPDGSVLDANQAFLRIVGYDQADIAAGRLRRAELTPPEWHDRDARAVAEMRATGSVQPFEKEYFRKDGSRVPVLIGGATLDERGDAVVIFAVDLTERKRAEAELAHANRVATMGQLTASIAHEVNQPIAALLTNAGTAGRWLTRRPPNLEKAAQLIERIISEAKRAADIVSRIRDFSQKAPGRKDLLGLNEAIVEVIGLTRAKLSDYGVLLQTELAQGLPLIQGDRVQLQQVMVNLIMNAAEAMSEVSHGPRELLITTRIEAGDVTVAVRDSGPGFSDNAFDKVFEAFYTTKSTGLGMGLSICRTIVEAHGGRLWASANVPKGAVFQFTIPVLAH
jgi:PAS domain S-box-containing protein